MSNGVQLRFDYAALDPETREFVIERAEKIHRLARMTAAGIVQIGQYLTEVKERLERGEFLKWIGREFNWKQAQAYRFMQVYENVKITNLINLEIDVSALYLIAAPSTPEPVREEALKIAISGEHVTHGTVKKVIAEYNKTGNSDKAVGQLFRAVAEARKEAESLPSPAEARRIAIQTGAHTLDRTGVYQPPITRERQVEFKADMMTTDPVFQFCRWVAEGTMSAEDAARIIVDRHWKQHYRDIGRAVAWLTELREKL